MKSVPAPSGMAPTKSPTGIGGFDEITGGGLPSGRTTLLIGGPGSGKTIFALQFLVHGAQACMEPGIFVAFEETAKRVVANAESFGWNLGLLQPEKVFILDAQPIPTLIQSGDFDLCGLLAALTAQARLMGARRIVFDALDVLLDMIQDPAARRREIYRLHAWLLDFGLTGLITAKAGGDVRGSGGDQGYGFMQFMVDCAVVLNHRVVLGVSQRHLRVLKFRGSGVDENESPFVIGSSGFEIAVARTFGQGLLTVGKERVSSGVERLDTMLGGGYYRGASVLITGYPGTAKTTLSGAFAEAACRRGDRTLMVSFDADSNEVVRDLTSVGIDLASCVKTGQLRMTSARTVTGNAETYLVRLKSLANEHEARCVIIDPVSTWFQAGDHFSAHSVAGRLIDWAKSMGITMLCTSLLDEMANQVEGGTALQISTLADTWIHLSYLVQAGERNRSLSIIKSRGTAHSNQVRELILSDSGVTLADAYTAGGEVLLGTMRWEKERHERVEAEATEVASRLKRVRLDAEEAELEVRLKSLQTELHAKQTEKELLIRSTQSHQGEISRGRTQINELRGADAAEAGAEASSP